jgi:hypothetical protein
MKNLWLTFLFLFFFLSVGAKKKKSRAYIQYLNGMYTNNDGVKKIGDVYSFTIQTLAKNILIDSIWFGNTPVPCDLLETKTNHKIDMAIEKGIYIVRANKNLYENFHEQFDSTAAYQGFKAPFPFKGDAVLMYKVNGKQYYKSIYNVVKGKSKGTR